MASDNPSTRDRSGRLSLAVVSGAFTRVHYGLILASSAAAMGREVTLFFTMDGTLALARETGEGAPGWTGLSGAERDRELVGRGVAGFEELIEACRDLGVRFLVCEAGLRALDLTIEDLRPDIEIKVAGAVTFLNDTSDDGKMMLI